MGEKIRRTQRTRKEKGVYLILKEECLSAIRSDAIDLWENRILRIMQMEEQ
jgi:hypothetical protein